MTTERDSAATGYQPAQHTWSAALQGGHEAIARLERKRSLEHQFAVDAAIATIEVSCALSHTVRAENWWNLDTLYNPEQFANERERGDALRTIGLAAEYLGLCNLLDVRKGDAGTVVRIRHEALRT